MKKMKELGLLAVGLLTVGSMTMADGLYLKGGVALPGKATGKTSFSATGQYSTLLTMTNSEATADSQLGFLLQGEYTKNMSKDIEVGAGISIEPEVKVKSNGVEDKMGCSWTPVYGVLKCNADGIYGIAKLGYGFANFTNEVKSDGMKLERNGGIYYSFGIGAEFDKMICELSYSVNSASQKISRNDSFGTISGETTVTYPKVGITIGYKL